VVEETTRELYPLGNLLFLLLIGEGRMMKWLKKLKSSSDQEKEEDDNSKRRKEKINN